MVITLIKMDSLIKGIGVGLVLIVGVIVITSIILGERIKTASRTCNWEFPLDTNGNPIYVSSLGMRGIV